MMKKLFWLVLSTVILTGQSIFAQEADSEVQSSQREDSLLQVVNNSPTEYRKPKMRHEMREYGKKEPSILISVILQTKR